MWNRIKIQFKKYSIQIIAALFLVQPIWIALPSEIKDGLPQNFSYIVNTLLALGAIGGGLMRQPGFSYQTKSEETVGDLLEPQKPEEPDQGVQKDLFQDHQSER